ncbi:MAG: hypothetical protein KC477_13425, partial [Oceanospirillaceae bacterium]|nr:hypothetical protein [Oceanospirillaceae bacterium]
GITRRYFYVFWSVRVIGINPKPFGQTGLSLGLLTTKNTISQLFSLNTNQQSDNYFTHTM